MERNKELDSLLEGFSGLHWLKPVDIVWNAANAYHIQKMITNDDVVLDLGCGDGLYSALLFGGKLPIEYDRFLNVRAENQKILENQDGDIYSSPVKINKLQQKPYRQINYGLELKQHHIDIAESLSIYGQILKGSFEDIPLDDGSIDKIYSIFAYYWGDHMDAQTREACRVLKQGGELIVDIPSEHLYDLHLVKTLAEDKKYSEQFRNYMESLDGGRRKLTSRYGKSIKDWEEYFKQFGFVLIEAVPVVNEVLFTLQDISQRPFLPMFFEMLSLDGFKGHRDAVKDFLCSSVYQAFINELLSYECESGVRHAYYLFRLQKAD